jgi:hypothetical protein
VRSSQQNRYLWGVVYPAILQGGGECLNGWEDTDLHEFFLGEHFGWQTLSGLGSRKRLKPLRRSARLTKLEFADFLLCIQAYVAELGIVIPEPEEP